jgi:hypothetical protein
MILTQQFVTSPNRREPHAYPKITDEAVDVLVMLDEASPLSEQLQALSKKVGLRDKELRALSGVSRATLARWRKEGDSERPAGLDDVRAIASLLIGTGAMRPRSVGGWLRSRNMGLDWQRPLEVLEAGDFTLVLRVAEAACGARIPTKQLPDDEEPTAESPIRSRTPERPI